MPSKRNAAKSARRHGVQSIEIGAQLLDALATFRAAVTLRDLSARAGMSSSKARRYLVSLLRCGLVEQDRTTGRYDLGAMSLRLGLSALSRRQAVRFATEALIELNQDIDKTVLLSVWSERGPTIIGWYDASEVLTCNLNVGAVLPLLRSATGRVFLSYLPRASTEKMVAQELAGVIAQLAESRIRTRDDVDRLIADVRKKRLGMTHEELVPGLSAVAAPVFDHQGRLVAAMAMLGLPGTIEDLGPNSPATILRRKAEEVSQRLGFQLSAAGNSHAEWLEENDSRGRARSDATEPPALANAFAPRLPLRPR